MERLINNTVVLLIMGLFFTVAIQATVKQPEQQQHLDDNEISVNEFNRITNNGDDEQSQEEDVEQMAANDQIKVLSRQLKMLTEQRQEDYRMLERSLNSYVQKHFEEYVNGDIKQELKDFR